MLHVCPPPILSSGDRKPINLNNFFELSRERVGVQFVCVLPFCWAKREHTYCGVQNYSVSGFIIFELFTVIVFQDWAGWGIFTVIPGNPRRTKGDSQHLEARPELQDWLRSELFTVKISRTGPFSNYLGNNFELYSTKKHTHTHTLPRKSQENAGTVPG